MVKRKPRGDFVQKGVYGSECERGRGAISGREGPRVCLSVHEGVCAGVCLCAHAVMGVGRGRQHRVRGRAWDGESREGTWGWVMEGSCKSVPRGNNQCLEEGGPCAHLLVVYFPSPRLFLFISNWAQ